MKIDADGYFSRPTLTEAGGAADQRFIPVGVNYWPASCGVEMWKRWPEDEIQHDLDVVKSLGLNTVRFFLRWQDFEPTPGNYATGMFERLERLMAWCQERQLYTNPSLFVGWMSGGLFWPAWKEAHNLYADPYMVERSTGLAQHAAQILRQYPEQILAIDLGNELDCVPDAPKAGAEAVRGWCQAVCNTIHLEFPGVLITSGTDHGLVIHDRGWRFGQQPGVDCCSMHGYPMPLWHTLGFDGMTDPLAADILVACTQVSRAFAPTFLQEFGTIATFGAPQQDTYLRKLLPAAWQAGANGFLWWCLRDITAPIHPYPTNHFESTLGLVDAAGQVKPGLQYFLDFCQTVQERSLPAWITGPGQPGGTTGIYLPYHYYPDDPILPPPDGGLAGLPQHPHQFARSLLIAHYLLSQLDPSTPVQFVRGDRPFDPGLQTILVPGILLSSFEAEQLAEWVADGQNRRLVWSGPDLVNWGTAYIHLLGAQAVDYRLPQPIQVKWQNHHWEFTAYPRDLRGEVISTSAQVLAKDPDGRPAILKNKLGQGCVIAILPCVEESVARVSADRKRRDAWITFYRQLFAA